MTNKTAPPADELEVDAAIAEYLECIDRGEQVNLSEFLHRHRELAPQLQEFFSASDFVEELVQGEPQRAANWSKETSRALEGTETLVAEEHEDWLLGQERYPTVPPPVFGRYRVVRGLGQGSMGTVYLAHDTLLDRSVALKIPRFEASDALKAVERFQNEARNSALLDHANICPIWDVGNIQGTPFLSMPYIEGQTLAQKLEARGPLPLDETMILVGKLAHALQEAHRHNVVHRDLKPANIMIDLKGEPKIMDFGLARRSGVGDPLVTQTGALVGTLAYMAPEQVDDERPQIGPATDIYSLGVILYQLLTGELPFKGTFVSVLVQLRHGKPVPLTLMRPELAAYPQVEALCERMMAKRSELRPQSMDEVVMAINAITAATSSPPPLPPEEPEPPPIAQPARAPRATAVNQKSQLLVALRRPEGLAAMGVSSAALLILVIVAAINFGDPEETGEGGPAAIAVVHADTKDLPQAPAPGPAPHKVPEVAAAAAADPFPVAAEKPDAPAVPPAPPVQEPPPAPVPPAEVAAAPAIVSAQGVVGKPFSIATLKIEFAEDAEQKFRPDQFLNVIDAEGRSFYPAFSVETEHLKAGTPPRLKSVVAHVLVRSSEPLKLMLTRDATVLATQEITFDAAADHRPLQEAWWASYSRPPLEPLNEQGRHLQQYLNDMLARRLELTPAASLPVAKDDISELQKWFERGMGYGLGFASVGEAFKHAHGFDQYGPAAVANQALPPDVPLVPVNFVEPRQQIPIEAIAYRTPAECVYVRVRSTQNYLWFRRLLHGWGGGLEAVVSARTADSHLREKIERQLAISPEEAGKTLSPGAISDLALLASDPYFRDGAGVGVLVEADKFTEVDRWIQSQRDASAKAHPDVSETSVVIGKHTVKLLSTRDLQVHSYYAMDGKFLLVTNSRRMVERFFATARGKESLGSLKEFRYARSKVRVHDGSVFLYMSDPFFRELASAEYQVELARRTRAKADLETLSLAVAAARSEGFRFRSVDDLIDGGYLPQHFTSRSDGSRPELRGDEVCDSLRGALGNFLPIPDMGVTKATPAEVQAYREFAQRYTRQWRVMDPVAVVIARETMGNGREQVRANITVTPYALEKYAVLRQYLAPPGGQRLAHHPNDLLSVDVALRAQDGGSFQAYAGVRDMPLESRMVDGQIVVTGPGSGDTLADRGGYLAMSRSDDSAKSAAFAVGEDLGMVSKGDVAATVFARGLMEIARLPGRLILPGGSGQRARHSVPNHEWFVYARSSELRELALRAMATDSKAQARLQLKEVAGSKCDPYIQQYMYLQSRRASAQNATLLNLAMQQLHLPKEQVASEIQKYHGAELLCPLGGTLELHSPSGQGHYWYSSHWGARSYQDEQQPHAEYRFAFLEWLRGMTLELQLDNQTLTADILLEVQPQ